MLTQDQVKSAFRYDPSTGILRWRIKRQGVYKGRKCNSLDADGYYRVKFNGRSYRVHRLIWLYVYGYLPEYIIDHRDQIKTNNRIENLREVSHYCSSQNRDTFKNNTSGIKGISWIKAEKKWKVTIASTHGGYFKTFDEAVAMRLALEQCLNWDGCYTNTPAYRYIHGK